MKSIKWLICVSTSFILFILGCSKQGSYGELSATAQTPLTLCSTVSNPTIIGAYSNPTGNPIGGGTGYTSILNSGTVTVTNETQLITELNNATSGKIIFIPGSAVIDLTGKRAETDGNNPIRIPQGVTIASDRGKNGSLGALIKISSMSSANNPALFVIARNARLTGLRIEGPFTSVGNETNPTNTAKVIGVRSDASYFPGSFKIDNSELYGWGFAAVAIYDGQAQIHHNYIHNNQAYRLGYGVQIRDNGKACIEANLFDKNRHAIATSGSYGNNTQQQGYEARFNLTVHAMENSDVYGTVRLHDFDAHGECEITNTSMSPYASHTVKIHHNTFLSTHNEATVLIRGKPAAGAWLEKNQIADTLAKGMIRQTPPSECQGRNEVPPL
jgi:hypothetical protein